MKKSTAFYSMFLMLTLGMEVFVFAKPQKEQVQFTQEEYVRQETAFTETFPEPQNAKITAISKFYKSNPFSLNAVSYIMADDFAKGKFNDLSKISSIAEELCEKIEPCEKGNEAKGFYYRVLSEIEGSYRKDYKKAEELCMKSIAMDKYNGIQACYNLGSLILIREEKDFNESAFNVFKAAFENDSENLLAKTYDYIGYLLLLTDFDKTKEALDFANYFVTRKYSAFFPNSGIALAEIFEKNGKYELGVLCRFIQEEFLYNYTGYRQTKLIEFFEKDENMKKTVSLKLIKALYNGESIEDIPVSKEIKDTWIYKYILTLSNIRYNRDECCNELKGMKYFEDYPLVYALLYLYEPLTGSDEEKSQIRIGYLRKIKTMDKKAYTGDASNIFKRMTEIVKAEGFWGGNALNITMVLPDYLKIKH